MEPQFRQHVERRAMVSVIVATAARIIGRCSPLHIGRRRRSGLGALLDQFNGLLCKAFA